MWGFEQVFASRFLAGIFLMVCGGEIFAGSPRRLQELVIACRSFASVNAVVSLHLCRIRPHQVCEQHQLRVLSKGSGYY